MEKMEYNSGRPNLIIREYGRNVQKMVDEAVLIEDKAERTKAAYAIVNIMAQLNPGQKDGTEERQKLWDHLFIISDFKLDIDAPFPMPDREVLHTKPDRLTYGGKKYKYRYYGSNVELMIKEACKLEDEVERSKYISLIASFMKYCYKQWNDDKVSDEIIISHLEELSGGKLTTDRVKDVYKGNLETKPVYKEHKKGKPKGKKHFRKKN
jgi:hypothetical protein